MKRVLIVDDEPHARCGIAQMLESYKDLVVVGKCGSISEARTFLAGSLPDLVFLDIILPDGNGFDLLATLEAIPFRVVFVTAHHEYAIRAIKYGALDYILKPVKAMELAAAVDRARESWLPEKDFLQRLELARSLITSDDNCNRQIVLKAQGYLQVVSFDEIIYCQSVGNYTQFHLVDKRKIIASRPLKEFHEDLLPRKLFMRTHRSYMVNLRFIDRFVNDHYLTLKGGEEVPVSIRKRETILAYFNNK